MTTQTITSSTVGGHSVCPWWMAYFFDNPLRRMIHPANKVLKPYVAPGMTVLDFGCGFGHFSLGMAKLTGKSGRVVATDVQEKMLNKVMNRARKTVLEDIIQPLFCDGRQIGVPMKLDFILACNSLHETPNPAAQLEEFFKLLNPGGRLLLMEPASHLKPKDFEAEVTLARGAGFEETDRPNIVREMCSLLQKPNSPGGI